MRYEYIDDVARAKELGLVGPRARTAHVHTLDTKPLHGASTVKGIVGSKDALMQWYADMSAVAGLKSDPLDIEEEYLAVQAIQDWKEKANAKKELDKKYPLFEEARKAAILSRGKSAEKGTERHGELEDYIRGCIKAKTVLPAPEGSSKSIIEFSFWAGREVDSFYFTEANCYSEELWTGGIADLGLKLKDGRRLIGDHKSSQSAYEDQFLQCAIYDVLLNSSGGLDRVGNKLFDWELADGYVVFPFRSDPFTPEFRWNADEFREGAKNTVQLYNLLNK